MLITSILAALMTLVPTMPVQGAHAPVPPLVHEGEVQASIDDVWAIFTTGEGFRKLGPAKADVDLRIGGLIRSHYSAAGLLDDEGAIHNQIIAFEPPRMLAMRIHRPPANFPFKEAWKETWSVITFTDLGDRTHVRIAGLGYTEDAESQQMRRFFQTGNQWTLQSLQSHFAPIDVPPQAEAHKVDPLSPIQTQVIIAASREEVWRTYTTSEGWQRFFNRDAQIGSLPGEPFEIYFDPNAAQGEQGSEGCIILSLIPGEMFSYTWNAPPTLPAARPERTWVVVRFEALSPTSTRVTTQHMGFAERAAAMPEHVDEWKQARAYFAQAWPYVLRALKRHLEADLIEGR